MTRDAAQAGRPAELFPLAPAQSSRRTNIKLVGGAIGFAFLIVWMFSSSDDTIRLAVLATILTAAFAFAVRRSLRHLEWLVFALIFEENLPYLGALPFDINTRWFLRLPLLLPLCIPAAWFAYRSGMLWKGRFKAMVLLFAWAGLTVIFSPVPLISLGRLAPNFLLFAAIVAIVANIESEQQVRRLIGCFLAASCVMVFFTFIGWMLLPSNLTHMLDDQGLVRFTGLSSDPNAVGSLGLVTVATGVAYWPHASFWKRFLIGGAILGALIFSVLADSRSETAVGLLGCAACAIWKWRFKAAAVCAALLMTGILSYHELGVGQRVYFDRGMTTFTGRTGAWRFELKRLQEHPLRGFGYQTEGEIFQNRYFDDWQTAWNRGPNTPLHDDYLSVAVDLGIPALVVWLVILVGPWWALFHARVDPWNLKPLFWLFVLPMLILALDESGMSEPRSSRGLLMFLTWALAERYSLYRVAQVGSADEPAPVTRLLTSAGALVILLGASSILGPGTAMAQPTRSSTPRYFSTLPPDASLPSAEQCAAWIPLTPETVPQNGIANHTRPTSEQLAELRDHGYHFTYMDDNSQYARIDGAYSGSTDMILRWAACKYGIDENVLRAQAWEESNWKQATHGDLHREPSVCRGGSTNLWEFDGCADCCWQSWSILQTKVVPYEWMTWPAIHESTSFAADYRAADQRSCMNGYYHTYFRDRANHAGHSYWGDHQALAQNAADASRLEVVLRGCIGKHFSGDWYDAAAQNYIAQIWRWVGEKPWLAN